MTVVTKQAWLDSAPWIDRPDADIDAYLARLDEDPGFDLRSALECWRRDTPSDSVFTARSAASFATCFSTPPASHSR